MEDRREQRLQEQLMLAQHRFIKAHKSLCFLEMGKSEFIMLDMILKGTKEPEDEDSEGIYVSEIARNLKISTPAVSKMLKGLEEKKYIERKTDQKDRRNTIVLVTERGKKARKRVFDEMDVFLKQTIEQLGEENTRELVRLLERYTEIVREESMKLKKKMQEERNEADI